MKSKATCQGNYGEVITTGHNANAYETERHINVSNDGLHTADSYSIELWLETALIVELRWMLSSDNVLL